VVISYYNAWPIKDLVALLDQMDSVPSGCTFDQVVVVNKGVDELIDLPDRHQHVSVLYRENSGYNIGAWSYGWKCNREYKHYLFLQDECVILKENWLKAFANKVAKKDGLIGESIVYELPSCVSDDLGFSQNIRMLEKRYSINKSLSDQHLQTLILFATSRTMELLNGFPCIGKAKSDGVAVEVSISRAVRSKGYMVEQVAFYPFEYIGHPQWIEERKRIRTIVGTLKRFYRVIISND